MDKNIGALHFFVDHKNRILIASGKNLDPVYQAIIAQETQGKDLVPPGIGYFFPEQSDTFL
jgi:hypothetical protein